MKENRKILRKEKGITLIALVITIIVLLILAGVSIAMLTGQNGILTQAQNAKNKTEEAQAEEQNILTNYEDYINNATLDTATVGEIVTGGNKQYSNNGKAIIPEGFAIVPGLDDVSQGLVISDVANDTENTGNQFVWVPVEKGKYIRNTSYGDTNVSETAYTDSDYLPDVIQPVIPEGTTEPETIGQINEEAERATVESAGGFYISRYEAGKETSGNTNILVSKSGATVWVDQTQEEFKDIAKRFSKNTEHVKSALCSGIQWDVTMAFITANDGSYSVTKATEDWHNGSLPTVSGANPEDKACNIYDLEGNLLEYVAEKNSYYTGIPIIFRGGIYDIAEPASHRGSGTGSGGSRSFRFVLYVI